MHIRDITKRNKIEKELKESVEWQRMIFEGSRDAIIISDTNSRIIEVNKASGELSGYSRKELLEMNLNELYLDTGEPYGLKGKKMKAPFIIFLDHLI